MFVPAAADPAGSGERSLQEKRALYAAAASKVRGFICVPSASTMKEEDDSDRSVQEKQAFLAAAANKIRGSWFPTTPTMKEEDAPAYYHELAGFYVEAARRLPIAEIPYLANCISISGLAVGLADPVTNIILTTISAFAHWPPTGPCVRPLKPDDALEKTRKKTTFADGAGNSRAGLVAFLTCYFRCLTEDQAKKLLDMAGHNLPLAIHLVEAGCWGLEVPLQPDAARTKTALQQAAKSAGRSMAGDLVRLMTWRYPRRLLHPAVLDDLRAAGNKQQLTPDCVYKLCDLLRCSWPPPQPTPAPTPGIFRDNSGNVTTILKIRKDLFATTTISKDLVTTTTITSTCPNNDVDDNRTDKDGVHLSTELAATDVLSSSNSVNSRLVCSWRENPDILPVLKISLLDTVHGFYIDALGMLPSHALREHHLLRSILAAGHCYGPLDPVSNIIVNSIWYHAAFPLSDDVCSQIGAADILDARSLTRVESRSLDGLVAFLCYTHSISEQQAVVLLCEHRFNLSYIFRGSPDKMFSHLAAAALVAKHPQPAAFGDFLTSLIPAAKLDRLCSLIYEKGPDHVLSGDTLDRLKNMVTNETAHVAPTAAAVPSMAPDLSQSSLETLSARREAFKSQQDYVRPKLEMLLLDYSRDKGHYYKLGIVCGVATVRFGFYSTCYHVNFLASRDVPNDYTRSWALFFAEFWSMVDSQVEHSANVPFCCPVTDSFNAYPIRCLICDQTSCKMAHLSCGEYVCFTGNNECGFPVHHEWGCDLGGMLESDFIYFNRESDEEVAKILAEESPSSPN